MPNHPQSTQLPSLLFSYPRTTADLDPLRDRLASWVLDTEPELFSWIFDGTEAAQAGLKTWVMRNHSAFSGTQATILWVDGLAAGTTIAWPGDEYASRHRTDTMSLIQSCRSDQRQALRQRLSAIMNRDAAPVRQDDWYIQTVALEPNHRGRGLSRPLLDRCLEQGKAAGFQQARLEVRAGNTAAVQLYLKTGFTIISEYLGPPFGVPVCSMARPL